MFQTLVSLITGVFKIKNKYKSLKEAKNVEKKEKSKKIKKIEKKSEFK